MEVHAPNPFLTSPFCCLVIPPPISWKPSFTYLEIPPLCCGANSCPLWSPVGCILPPPLTPPFPFPSSNGFPYSNACPLTTTLRYRLHIVRYNKVNSNRHLHNMSMLQLQLGQVLDCSLGSHGSPAAVGELPASSWILAWPSSILRLIAILGHGCQPSCLFPYPTIPTAADTLL